MPKKTLAYTISAVSCHVGKISICIRDCFGTLGAAGMGLVTDAA